MPWTNKWVVPEKCCTIRLKNMSNTPIVVYHSYNEDEMDQRQTYWFTLDPHDGDSAFDIRELDAWLTSPYANDPNAPYMNTDTAWRRIIGNVLRKAIKTGELVPDPSKPGGCTLNITRIDRGLLDDRVAMIVDLTDRIATHCETREIMTMLAANPDLRASYDVFDHAMHDFVDRLKFV